MEPSSSQRYGPNAPKIPIVLVSGVVDVLGLDEKTTGANVVIPKSSTEVTHLIRAVKRLLNDQTPKKPVRSQSGKKPGQANRFARRLESSRVKLRSTWLAGERLRFSF